MTEELPRTEVEQPEPEQPAPEPTTPAGPTVSVKTLRKASMTTTPLPDDQAEQVDRLVAALRAEGLIRTVPTGSYSWPVGRAYRRWQTRCGSPSPTGDPDLESLAQLGQRHGFTAVV